MDAAHARQEHMHLCDGSHQRPFVTMVTMHAVWPTECRACYTAPHAALSCAVLRPASTSNGEHAMRWAVPHAAAGVLCAVQSSGTRL